MTVLRIEHSEDGSGPYVGRYEQYRKFRSCHNQRSHPSPRQEGLKHTKNHYSGFKTKETLTNWFSKKELKLLHRAGFVVSTYRMLRKDMDYSSRQAIFIREESKLIKTASILTLIP